MFGTSVDVNLRGKPTGLIMCDMMLFRVWGSQQLFVSHAAILAPACGRAAWIPVRC